MFFEPPSNVVVVLRISRLEFLQQRLTNGEKRIHLDPIAEIGVRPTSVIDNFRDELAQCSIQTDNKYLVAFIFAG